MQFQYVSYIWILIFSALVTLGLGLYSFVMQREAKGTKSFILCMLAAITWAVGNALEMAASDLSTKLFWANIQYLAYCYSPLLVLSLSLQFTGYDQWLRDKKILWLAVIPTIVVLLVWTNDWHGLIRHHVYLESSGSFPVIAKTYGPAFYVHIVYAYLLNLTSSILLLRAVFFRNTVYRKQALALLVGLVLIILPNILYVIGVSPIERFDITPVFFAPAGLVFAWGIYRYKLFNLIPVARATIIENMDVGVMVVDLQDRILDANPAFEKIVGFQVSQIAGRTVDDICAEIPELVTACTHRSVDHSEFTITRSGVPKVYEALLSPLTDNKGRQIGRLAAIHDITAKKKAEQEFLKQQRRLTVIEERERLAKDMHDNLGQVLGFINLQAQGISQELARAGVNLAADKLEKLVEVTRAIHEEVREYIRSARNTADLEIDFIRTSTRDIIAFGEQSGLKIKLEAAGSLKGVELEPDILHNLLSILKEALNNTRKHSEADEVTINFSLAANHLRITVEDNGKGFEPAGLASGPKTKFGLDIMRERALEIGAQLTIQSAAGQGSRIQLCLPLKGGRK